MSPKTSPAIDAVTSTSHMVGSFTLHSYPNLASSCAAPLASRLHAITSHFENHSLIWIFRSSRAEAYAEKLGSFCVRAAWRRCESVSMQIWIAPRWAASSTAPSAAHSSASKASWTCSLLPAMQATASPLRSRAITPHAD